MPKFAHVQLVGTHFRGLEAKALVAGLSVGDSIKLEREADNQYDANAIKCLIGDEHVGYIDRNVAAYLAPYMDDGQETEATVVDFMPGAKVTYPLLDINFVSGGSVLAGLSDPLDNSWGDA